MINLLKSQWLGARPVTSLWGHRSCTWQRDCGGLGEGGDPGRMHAKTKRAFCAHSRICSSHVHHTQSSGYTLQTLLNHEQATYTLYAHTRHGTQQSIPHKIHNELFSIFFDHLQRCPQKNLSERIKEQKMSSVFSPLFQYLNL